MTRDVIIGEMVALQDELNKLTIGMDWKDSEKDWKLAAMMEATEAIDHLGWKWWTKQPNNIEAAKVEIIDIHHFVLSEWIACYGNGKTYQEVGNALADYELRCKWINKNVSAQQLLRTLIVLAADNDPAPIEFGLPILIGEKLGMSFEEQSKLYRQKVILNTFRQNHGYRTGGYKKLWNGKEDNDWMLEISAKIDWRAGNAGLVLYKTLEDYYKNINF